MAQEYDGRVSIYTCDVHAHSDIASLIGLWPPTKFVVWTQGQGRLRTLWGHASLRDWLADFFARGRPLDRTSIERNFVHSLSLADRHRQEQTLRYALSPMVHVLSPPSLHTQVMNILLQMDIPQSIILVFDTDALKDKVQEAVRMLTL